MKNMTIFLIILSFLIPLTSFAAKAVCVAKNVQTRQIYQAVVGKQSYSVAKRHSSKLALIMCARRTAQSQYCRLNGCYKR